MFILNSCYTLEGLEVALLNIEEDLRKGTDPQFSFDKFYQFCFQFGLENSKVLGIFFLDSFFSSPFFF